MEFALKQITAKASDLTAELCDLTKLRPGQILVVGCSTSEILGNRIGKAAQPEVGIAVADGVLAALKPRGVYLAAQCCEHLNRSIVIERAAANPADIVNAVPRPHAGGSFATAVYSKLTDPVVVEVIQADAGLDFGDTLIGMHLKRVVLPVRLTTTELGAAHVTAGRTRPKYIGGERTVYDDALR